MLTSRAIPDRAMEKDGGMEEHIGRFEETRYGPGPARASCRDAGSPEPGAFPRGVRARPFLDSAMPSWAAGRQASPPDTDMIHRQPSRLDHACPELLGLPSELWTAGTW